MLLRAGFFGTAAVLGFVVSAEARVLTLSIGDLEAPGFSAQSVRANLSGPRLQELALDIERLSVAGRTWRKVKLACPGFVLTAERVACTRGLIELDGKLPLSFSYRIRQRELRAELKLENDELWRIDGRFSDKPSTLEVQVEKGRIERFASWLPESPIKLRSGRVNGRLKIQGPVHEARLDIDSVAFADAEGLHAGEKLAGALELRAVEAADGWRWNASLAWRAGEVFWQPFYLAAKGHRMEVQGTTFGPTTRVHSGRLDLPSVGSVSFSGEWNHSKAAFSKFAASASRIKAAGLYESVMKPILQGTALSDLRADGEASFALSGAGSVVSALDLDLDNVSFEDRQRRFAVFGLSGRVPWRRDEASTGEIVLKGAELLKVPVGAMRVPLHMRGTRIDVAQLRMPLFDGALVLRDFAARMTDDGWRWRFSGKVEPISMVQLTQALGMPTMHGSLGGAIPELRYRRRTLSMDGALEMRVFDGAIAASNVELIEPFGRGPRLHADLDMKNIDLELLTRALDFGTITGRIDARVRGLELVAWEPVKFDVHMESSRGTYPRKISQRAVQNISALGGAGAAAAIQRSLLRFFEQFGYERLGLSCRLENGVCEMGGLERAPQGYVIVKGGGIPAISVIGYNRFVDWRELVERLKRVTQDNVKPIVK